MAFPFDQYQRYRIVADALGLLRKDAGSLNILDVGGGEGIILNFLTEDRVTVLDLQDVEGVPGLIRGDATALPFEDGTFDYVVSVDVYEHIEPGVRDRYLSELRRTARRGVLLAAPFDSPMVRAAERVANEFHRSVHRQENVWLKEHAENGLPRLDEAREFFEQRGDAVSVLPNGYVPHWLVMMCLTFYSSKLEDEPRRVFEGVSAFYNEFMYGLDNAQPCYRHLLISLREPADVGLEALISSDPRVGHASEGFALAGMISAMLPMTIARKEGELARKEAQVKDLTRRLAEQVRVSEDMLHPSYENLQRQRDQLREQLEGITGSRAWRLLTVLHKLRLGFRRPRSG
jgi:O-antigen biosynthesis protein